MLVEGGLDAAELRIRQRLRKIDVAYLGAYHIGRWHDFHDQSLMQMGVLY